MRNLKKVLSLVLALVMTLSLATVAMAAPAPTTTTPTTETTKTTSSLDFTDADDIENVDEVALLNSLGILAGYEDGSFGPEKTVTRAEAAKIVCYVLLGADVASGLGDATVETSFTDMDGAGWASGYVQYCATVGIINGYGDGRFGPQDTVTTYQLAKMLLVALGYGQNDEYTGSSWATNVAVDAMKSEILPTGTINEDCTRDMTALVAYNTLLAPTATYADGVYSTQTEKTVSTTITVGGSTLPYSYTTEVDNTSLGEQNFDLVKYTGIVTYTTLNGAKTFAIQKTDDAGALTSTYVGFSGTVDMMNRSATVWTLYNSKTKVYTLVTDVVINGKTLSTTGDGTEIADLTDPTDDDYVASFNYASNVVDADFYVNGSEVQTVTASGATITAGYYVYNSEVYYTSSTTATPASDKCVAGLNGVGVELYDSDSDGDVDAVFVTAKTVYTLAADVATKVVDGDTIVTITTNEGTTIKEDSDEIVGYEDLEKGDVILAVEMGNGVTYIESAKSVEGTLSKIAQKTVDGSTVYTYTFAGTAYNASGLFNADATDLNSYSISSAKTIAIYLDSFGYIVASGDVDATTDTKFIYVTKVYSAASSDKYSSTSTVTWVQGVLTDGTTVEYEVYNGGTAGNTFTVDSTTYTVGTATGNAYTYGSLSDTNNAGNIYQYVLTDDELVLIVPTTTFTTSKVEGTQTSTNAIYKSSSAGISFTYSSTAYTNYFASDVNFIYVSGSGSTLKVSTLSGIQNVIAGTSYDYTVAKDSDGNYVITAVYLSGTAGVASSDLIYLGSGAFAGTEAYTDSNSKTKTGYNYNVYIDGTEKTILTTNSSVTADKFYLYTVSNDVYTLTQIDDSTYLESNYCVRTNNTISSIYNNYFTTTAVSTDWIATDAVIVDLVNTDDDDIAITTMSALAKTAETATIVVSFAYDSNYKVSVIYITSITAAAATVSVGTTLDVLSTTLTASVSAGTPTAYQWYYGTTAVSGATSSTLTVAAADAGSYYVVATVNGTTVTSAAVTVAFTYTVAGAVTGLTAADVTTGSGDTTATLTASGATGNGTITYEWFSVATSGATTGGTSVGTGASVSVNGTAGGSDTYYYVVATNTYTDVASTVTTTTAVAAVTVVWTA